MIAVTSINYQVKQMKKMVAIFFGHTQSAKSSTIKDLTGDTSVVCGNGTGSSTTNAIKIHHPISPKLSDSFIFMDTIGMGDNSLTFTPQKIREEIELNIISLSNAQKCDEIQGIIITEPLKDGAYQLPNTLELITQIFGSLPNKSIVILGTKSHNQPQDDVQLRQNAIKGIMRDFQIPPSQYIRFATTYKRLQASQIDKQQYADLQDRLRRCQKLNAKSIQDKLLQINNRAKQIQVERTEVRQHPYTHNWTEQRWDGDLGKIFGKKKTKNFSQTRYHTTKHEPPFDFCYDLALKEFQTSMRQKLLQAKK